MLNQKINEYKKVNISPKVNNYFSILHDQLDNKKQYFQLINEMLKSNKKEKLINFVMLQKEMSESLRKRIFKKISNANSKDEILDIVIYLISRESYLPLDKLIQTEFDTLMKTHFIKLTSTYD